MDYTDYLTVLSDYPFALRVTEVAEVLRVSKFLVYRMINEHQLMAITVGREKRISKSELIHFIQTGKSLYTNPEMVLVDKSVENSWTLEKVCDMCCVAENT